MSRRFSFTVRFAMTVSVLVLFGSSFLPLAASAQATPPSSSGRCTYMCRLLSTDGTTQFVPASRASSVSCTTDSDCQQACESGTNSCESTVTRQSGRSVFCGLQTSPTENVTPPSCVIRAAAAATSASSEPSLSTFYDPLAGRTIPAIIGGMIKGLFGIAGALFLAFFIYGGVTYMISSGDPNKVKEAQKTLVRAVMGMVIIMFSYTLLSLLLNLTQSSISGGGETGITTGPAATPTTQPELNEADLIMGPANPPANLTCNCTCVGGGVTRTPTVMVNDCGMCNSRCSQTCRPLFDALDPAPSYTARGSCAP